MGLKQSRYNLFFDGEGGAKLAFNSMTAALAEIEPDKWPMVQAFLENPNREPENETERDLLENLKYGGFLIDENFDEIAYLKVMTRLARFSGRALGLTVCPTMTCNFACPYCYETANPDVMSEEVQDKLKEFVERRLERVEKFEVAWYGGEPLLAFDVIENLSLIFMKLSETKGVAYRAEIYTNGYLLSPEKSKRLADLMVKNLQVTLDGPPAIHDRRRVLANGAPTFWRILENLKSALGHIENVTVRVNVDKENRDKVLEILDLLEREGLKERIRIYFTPTSEYSEVCSAYMREKGFSIPEHERIILELLWTANLKKGWDIPVMPTGGIRVCGAEADNWFVILPDGSLRKCWLHLSKSEESFGNITDSSTDEDIMAHRNYNRWLLTEPFDSELCLTCKQLPFCMGECAYSLMKQRETGICEARAGEVLLREYALLALERDRHGIGKNKKTKGGVV